MRTILFVATALVAFGQAKFEAAVVRVQVSIGLRLLIDVGTVNQAAFLFPNGSDSGEAWVTRDAVYVSREKIASMKSGRELAQFLSHAQAHARLNHPAKYAEHQQLMRMLELSPHVPPEIVQRSWELWRLKQEQEAQALGEQIFAATDCAQGKCKEFDDLWKEARRK